MHRRTYGGRGRREKGRQAVEHAGDAGQSTTEAGSSKKSTGAQRRLMMMAAVGTVMLIAAFLRYGQRRSAETSPSLSFASSSRPMTQERMVACVPTVTRRDGIEYVAAAVQSFREVTADNPFIQRMIVFNMDAKDDTAPRSNAAIAALRAAVQRGEGQWLALYDRLPGDVPPPQRQEHGDSPERIQWRSKEAWDYAEVLERCVALAPRVDYYLVVQDDTIFDESFKDVVEWTDSTYTRRSRSCCVLSLSDVKQKMDAREERVANMVAKVFRKADALQFSAYARELFDHSPIDWLVRDYCRAQSKRILVRVPNPVHHRGIVSSFRGNRREGLMT